jgi:hypothetical protein
VELFSKLFWLSERGVTGTANPRSTVHCRSSLCFDLRLLILFFTFFKPGASWEAGPDPAHTIP